MRLILAFEESPANGSALSELTRPQTNSKQTLDIAPNMGEMVKPAELIEVKGASKLTLADRRLFNVLLRHAFGPDLASEGRRFEIDPASPHAFRQINAIADGLVMRHSVEAGHWDGGTLEVLAGFIAHVLSAENIQSRSLSTMRELLTEADSEKFTATVGAMSLNLSCGRLPITGAGKLTKTGSEAGHFLSGAVSNSKWLDDPFMSACLSESSFRLSDLKREKMTVYLVLPMDALGDYGRFLRLFVRMALYHMQQKLPDGALKGQPCMFILDEFFSLGRIDEIAKSAGGLPGFGLHLWPFLQDYNQLLELYGRAGAGTFFANSDATYFFGVNDQDTAEIVSKGAGLITESDINVSPPVKPKFEAPPLKITQDYKGGLMGRLGFGQQIEITNPAHEQWRLNSPEHQAKEKKAEAQYTDEMNRYHHARQSVGHARIAPEQVMQMTARNPKRKVADHALVLHGGVCYRQALKAYFESP